MHTMIRNGLIAGMVIAIFSIATTAPTAAEPLADIKYRKLVMKALGGHMGSIVGIVKGEVVRKGHLERHANAIADIGQMTGDLFPKGSDMGETEALPVIWEKPAAFQERVEAMKKAGAALAAAAKGDNIKAAGTALGAVGKACGGCHKNFRKKKS